MRSTAMQYVGIDVHQATLVCVVKDQAGQTTIESKVATRREAIESFVRGLGGRVRIAFEEGTQAQWLYELLRPISERVIVCDPRKMATQGNKDDQRDAERICELLRLNALQPVYHDHSDQKLKELVRCYEALVDDSLRVMLRVGAIYRSRAISVRRGRCITPQGGPSGSSRSRMAVATFAPSSCTSNSTSSSNYADTRASWCYDKRAINARTDCCGPCQGSGRFARRRSLRSSAIHIAFARRDNCGLTPAWA